MIFEKSKTIYLASMTNFPGLKLASRLRSNSEKLNTERTIFISGKNHICFRIKFTASPQSFAPSSTNKFIRKRKKIH